jgi:hypothetical protein
MVTLLITQIKEAEQKVAKEAEKNAAREAKTVEEVTAGEDAKITKEATALSGRLTRKPS